MKTIHGLVAVLIWATAAVAADLAVTDTRTYTDPDLGLTAVAATLELPAGAGWSAIEPGGPTPLRQVYLMTPSAGEGVRGSRVRKAELARQIEQERYPLWTIYAWCAEHARTNNGIAPAVWIDGGTNRTHGVSLNIAGIATNYVLIPSVPILEGGGPRTNRAPLALQLRPLVADGKHWVVYNDGQSERVPIDAALCARYGITVRAQRQPESDAAEPAAGTQRWSIGALIKPGAAVRETQLMLTNRTTGTVRSAVWDLRKTREGDRSVLAAWATARAVGWARLAAGGDAPVLSYWLSRCEKLYGANVGRLDDGSGRNREEAADAFSVLGGRAAVRETLQMQPLRGGAGASSTSLVAVSTLQGVEVKSHPFTEMLAGVQPGSLPLADSVPADRAFVYFPKPAALIPLLEGGADFVFQGGSLALANPAAYDLKRRYLDRLAVTDQWVRDVLLRSGAVREAAIVFPDLFFIDGTEVTVLARIPAAGLLKPALASIGLDGLADGIREKSGPAGTSYWTLDGDLLVISTSRDEAGRVVALRHTGGVGSLGRSAEFRYMLAQTPLRPETRCYCYLSDPFIRRLVSPAVKIGQLRRLQAKGEMETVTAAALLSRLDGQAAPRNVGDLLAKGYLDNEPAMAAGCAIDSSLASSCPTYGSPASLKTLLETPVTTVSQAEADAYKAYLENYSRFWRRYFDPMAFRLDDGPGGELQLTTLILPLVDNSIYNGLKAGLRRTEDGTPLKIPDLNPKPLLLLSANLSEDVWTKVTKEMFADLLRRYTTVDPVVFDKIGPGVHLAVHDADPIITFGSGDALGVFGAPMMTGGRNMEMVMIPVIASVLTRPCQLIVELQDPAAVRNMLRATTTVPFDQPPRWGSRAAFCKVEGRDAWICTISIEGIVRIRFGVEVRDAYLILSNLPWSQKPTFGPSRNAALNAMALSLHPEAGVLQMPGLFTAACEQERAAAVQGARYLHPLLMAGADSVAGAGEMCRALFGFLPEHPGKGEWIWEDGEVRSTVYGSASRPVQPEYRSGGRAFGTLDGLETLSLNLQFEDAGLRVVTSWKLKEPGTR